MSLESYFNNLFASSSSTMPPEFLDSSKSLTSEDYSIYSYEPIHSIELDGVLKFLHQQEILFAEKEEFLDAAILRDKITSIKENRELFIKLFDIKLRALHKKDYKFASKIQSKINKLLKQSPKHIIS